MLPGPDCRSIWAPRNLLSEATPYRLFNLVRCEFHILNARLDLYVNLSRPPAVRLTQYRYGRDGLARIANNGFQQCHEIIRHLPDCRCVKQIGAVDHIDPDLTSIFLRIKRNIE